MSTSRCQDCSRGATPAPFYARFAEMRNAIQHAPAASTVNCDARRDAPRNCDRIADRGLAFVRERAIRARRLRERLPKPRFHDASARAEVSAAIWQPIFACMPLDATRVRLNADVTYAWKSERRLTTSLGLTVAQLFRVGPYEAEVSSAVRAQPEANVFSRYFSR
jgi:hypothetical protein